LRVPPPDDGANRRRLPERLFTWPRAPQTSLLARRFVSTAVTQSGDILNLTRAQTYRDRGTLVGNLPMPVGESPDGMRRNIRLAIPTMATWASAHHLSIHYDRQNGIATRLNSESCWLQP